MRSLAIGELVLDRFAKAPFTSTREVEPTLSYVTMWGTLRYEGMQIFPVQRVQYFNADDCQRCLDLMRYILDMITNNSIFLALERFTDEDSLM